MTEFLKQHAGALVFSVLLHAVLISLLGVTLTWSMPKRATQQLAIEAVVVDSSILTAKQRQQDDEQQRRRQAELQRQREREVAEQQRQQEQEAKREAERVATQQAQAEAERKAEEEVKRKAEAETKRKAEAEAKRKAEAEAKLKAEAEAKRKAEAEAKRKVEAEAKRKAEQQRQREEAEMRAAMRAEEELLALQQSDAMNQYQWQIQQRIERSWIRPPSARVGLSCELVVIQTPTGDVIDARVGRCNGDDVVIRSLEAAVLRASPLPEPPDPRLYSRNLTILFEPEE